MTRSDKARLPVDKAVELLRAQAFEVTDPESQDHGRRLVHCRLGGFGADWDLEDAISLVGRSTWTGYVVSIFDHNLGVEAEGKLYCFAVKLEAPDGVKGL